MSKKLSRKLARNNSRPLPGPGHVIEIKGEKQFEGRVLNADKPVLVDFWAPWCQPCKMMGPIFEAVARSMGKEVRFAKVNTEANPKLAAAFNIASIPSLLVFDRGEVIDSRIGLTSRGSLEALAQRALDKHNGVSLGGKIRRLFGGKAATAAG